MRMKSSNGTMPTYNDYYWGKGAVGPTVFGATSFWKISGDT